MRGTKRLAHRHNLMSASIAGAPGLRAGLLLGLAMSLFALARPVQAQRLPLPPDEQEAVNQAIDRGVAFLKKTQLGNGSWVMPRKSHEVGYAVLPALTLLECGVLPSDRSIQRTVVFLRSRAGELNTTYELSLAILFLDRLGSMNPRDEKIIRTFALRLIAGQSATGGWGYKCPGMKELPARMQMDLLTALRRLEPPPVEMPLLAGDLPNQPGIADKRRPSAGGLTPIAEMPGAPLSGEVAEGSTPTRLEGGTALGPTASRYTPPPGLAQSGDGQESTKSDSVIDLPGPPQEKNDADTPEKDDEKDSKASGKAVDGKGRPGADKAEKPYHLPERLKILPVIQDPALHLLQDPEGKAHDLIVTTTDNSNTQFAILALWTAQRHSIPMRRSLNLVVRRYLTSQNNEGSWSYHYRFGGGSFVRPNTMTCVGLIGLAVGHGLAQRKDGKPVRDPRVLNGFAALSKFIGQPAERIRRLPMQNLYFLWSVERVAVLYNLPMIADKDWYRWGAQILVANQSTTGNWAEGQYPGSSPVIDTCLALLFLKRANLVKDLTAKLPFEPDDLNNGVMEKLAPPPVKMPEPAPKKTLPPEKAPTVELEGFVTKPGSDLQKTTATPQSADIAPEGLGSRKKWIALALVLAVVLGGSGLFFVLIAVRRKKDEKEDRHARKKRKDPKSMRMKFAN